MAVEGELPSVAGSKGKFPNWLSKRYCDWKDGGLWRGAIKNIDDQFVEEDKEEIRAAISGEFRNQEFSKRYYWIDSLLSGCIHFEYIHSNLRIYNAIITEKMNAIKRQTENGDRDYKED